ncbi:hypothetical protein RN001_006047 [Aquatica leii]|uniref:Uncharacterized protein n=1 Tax=Aquatica leii TaxID=1421715 RepID=A0AAN7PDJ4_9COLE|nr:hypothetical protein RN001_006047 [Aquatica leii]
MNRILKTLVPTSTNTLKPEFIDHQIVNEKLKNNQLRQKHFYDRTAKDLPELYVNDKVFFQKNDKWEKGVVIHKHNLRSYIIKDENGNQFRRNRKFISKTNLAVNLDDDVIYETTPLLPKTTENIRNRENTNDNNCNSDIRTRSGRIHKLPHHLKQDFVFDF